MNFATYQLEVDLSTIESWEAFAATAEPYSIALDGKVKAPTREDVAVPIANYNHHDGVDRYSTRATCEQVFDAIKMGLFRAFEKRVVMVNDCDQDVVLSNALLRSPHLVDSPLISRLVSVEGRLDVYGGGYSYDPTKMPFLDELVWIFEPFDQFRRQGGLQRGASDEYRRVIEDSSSRVDAYAMGKAGTSKVDDRYDRVGEVGGFTEIVRIGSMASLALARDGVGSTIEFKNGDNGLLRVTMAKVDRFQPSIDFERLADELNKVEEDAGGKPDWGGGNAYCCSPRNLGTVLTRECIEYTINGLKR